MEAVMATRDVSPLGAALPRGVLVEPPAVCRRVWVGLRTHELVDCVDAYWPSLPSPVRTSACDGGRSRLPLRGSPGIPPGSLLRLARGPDTNTPTTMQALAAFVKRE